MSHTRSYLENMIGQSVHLVLKNGNEYVGLLQRARWRSFGFSIRYFVIQANGSYCEFHEFDFVKSDIKKIRKVKEDGKA